MTDTAQPRSLRDAIHDMATSVGAVFATDQYDGGQRYTITMPGQGSVAVSADWGDDPQQIVEILRSKMQAAGWGTVLRHQYLLDFGGGRTALLWAPDERTAVRLAGQGEPESVTDLSTGESHEWTSPA